MPDLPLAETPNTPQPSIEHRPSPVPESAFTSQEPPAPMIDIHPPHHAATTWRDFFIHIATIVIGLLIAIGLEQTVEYFHHRHLAHDARRNIQQEIDSNMSILEHDLEALAADQQQLSANLDQLNSGAAEAQVLPRLKYEINLARRKNVAWVASKIDGSLALIPSTEIAGASFYYGTADDITPIIFAYFTDIETAASLVDHATIAGKLTEPERLQLLSLTASAMGRDKLISEIFASELRSLQRIHLD